MLKGYKTYLAAILSLAGVWGSHLSGTADIGTAINATVTAILAMTLRSGMKADK